MQIKDRTFIVSGGSSGLGLATTSLLLSQGANVSILDLNPPPSEKLPTNTSCQYLFTKTDVSTTPSLHEALQVTLKWIASTTKPLFGTICCAGIGPAALSLPKQQSPTSASADVKYMDMRLFDRVLAINLRGSVDLIRLTLPHLAQNEPDGPDGERGVIIVVSSVAAYEGQVGQLAYSASKGGIASMVLPLARELGQKAGIRVMGVAPGIFQTGMTTPNSPPRRNQPNSGSSAEAEQRIESSKPKHSPMSTKGINPEMVQYPTRMGRGDEFARLVKEIVENPMLNGFVIRLDGGVRLPSRL